MKPLKNVTQEIMTILKDIADLEALGEEQ